MYVEEVVEIAAPPERVWAVMADVERWPRWTSSVTEAQRLESGPLEVGARARVTQPKLAPAIWRVTVLDPGRSFEWVTGIPGLRSTGVHTVVPSSEGSRVTLAVRTTGIFAWLGRRWLGPLTREYVATEAAGLKRECEGRAAASR